MKPLAVRQQKAEVEATDGGSSRQERVSFAISVMEVHDFEFEEELSSMVTLIWTEGVWMSRWRREQQKAKQKQVFEVQRWKQVRGLVNAVTCETRDLGIRWHQRHTLFFVQGR